MRWPLDKEQSRDLIAAVTLGSRENDGLPRDEGPHTCGGKKPAVDATRHADICTVVSLPWDSATAG